MAHFITDECITCGSCQSVCPVEAISEGEDKYVIDPKLCTDCGTCAEQCPVEAITPGDDK
jgi:ferredoxin